MNYKKKQMVAKIMKLAIDVTQRTSHEVCFDYSGHVNWLEVTVNYYNKTPRLELLPAFTCIENHTEEALKNAIVVLKSLLRGDYNEQD